MIEELHGTKETVHHSNKTNFRLYLNTGAENYPLHWHTDLEIIMPLENQYTVILEEIPYVLQPEDILLIPAGEMHRLLAPSSGKRLIFQVDFSILQEVNGFDSIYSKFFPCAIFRRTETPREQQHLTELLKQIFQEQQNAAPLYEASIHALLIRFLVEAGRLRLLQAEPLIHVKKQKQQSYIELFFNLCSYINAHCTEDLSLEQVSSMTGFSKSHFMRLFKEFTGVSYYEYLTRRRMLHAEILLNHPECSIAAIAMQSGFNSLATFNRVFKACHHCTPTEYRNRFQPDAFQNSPHPAPLTSSC